MKTNELKHKLNLQFFANGGEDNNQDLPQDQDGHDNPGDDNKDDKKPETKKIELTQEELDAIIKERLSRERKKYSDYDELRKKLEEYEKAEEERKRAQMSELERLRADLQAKTEAEEALRKQLEDWQESYRREKITNEFIKLATSYNIAYIDDAMKLADLSAVSIDEEGKVVGMEDVVKKLVKDKPYLVAQPKQPKRIGEPTGSSDGSQKTAEQLLKEYAEKAKNSNRIEDKIKYAQLKRELGIK